MPYDRPDWTSAEIANYLDVDPSYIRAEVAAGRLNGTKRAGRWFFTDEEVRRWLSNRTPRHKDR